MDNFKKFVLIYNIPKDLKTKHLRKFFKGSIESKVFRCFHFRHRRSSRVKSSSIHFDSETFVCPIKFNDEKIIDKFIKFYNDKYWTKKKKHVCKICRINLIKENYEETDGTTKESERENIFDLNNLSEKKLKVFSEMRPPRVLKEGNVGTSLESILQSIRTCCLPPSLLPKLGIRLQHIYSRKVYSSIPLNYKALNLKARKKKNLITKNIEGKYLTWKGDEKEAEEWERHEMLREDPFKMVPKEKHYEQKLSVVWEKGGPGIVWYTDLNFWDEMEEEEEKETDDWDVDFSEEDEKEQKTEYETFKKKDNFQIQNRNKKKNKNINQEFSSSEEENDDQTKTFFNKYSKFFASKLMKKYGWQEGRGLGKEGEGMTQALGCEGQKPNDKTGFGYKGPKIIQI